MKVLYLILFTLISAAAFGQRDKTFPRAAQKPYEKVTEAGTVTFTKTLNSIQFERSVSAKIKEKVTRFMKTNRRGYTSLGTYTLHLVKRNGELYIMERENPDKLILIQ